MNIDERLEKLAERHEALTHTVELMALGQHRVDERLEGLTQTLEITAGMQRENERQISQLNTLMGHALEAIACLANVA